jgi:hypothetical protein
MVLATLVLLCAVPQTDDGTKASAALSVTAFDSTSRDSAEALPSAPEPKLRSEAEPAPLGLTAEPFEPVRPRARRPDESPTQRKMWYGLLVTGHAAAGFDAWSTRRAVSRGYGQEANPFLKPFAHSNAIYAATQVSPAFMDFLGKRMMVSQNPWIRKFWWFPQMAGAAASFVAVRHNLGVVP